MNKEISQISAFPNLDFDTNPGYPAFIKATGQIPLSEWIQDNHQTFEKLLNTVGAVLFRGFDIDSVQKFEHVMKSVSESPLPYKFRSSPRYSVGENVYVSTTYPKEEMINMHSENSYAKFPPNNIVFCCVTPAAEYGETPIADNRKVLTYLEDHIVQKFEKHGVEYVQTIDNWVGLSWQEVFQTTDKNAVEKECIEGGIEFEWISDNKIRLKWKREAIIKHPKSGELTWFNHACFFNKYALSEELREYFELNDSLPYNTFYGDGTPISEDEITNIKEAYRQSTVMFEWKKGDVLFLDNLLSSHGRNKYSGEREIIVSVY